MQTLENLTNEASLQKALAYIENNIALHRSNGKTGFAFLDNHPELLQDGDITLIASRPAMGKTALLLNLLTHFPDNATEHRPRLVATGLTCQVQCALQIMAIHARVNRSRLRRGLLVDDDWEKLPRALMQIKGKPLYIDDSIRSISNLKDRIQQIADIHGQTPIVGVDSINQLAPYHSSITAARRAELVEGLKALAEDHQLPALATDTISGEIHDQQQGMNRPRMAWIDQIESFETRLDNVLMLYREAVYHPEKSSEREKMEIIFSKNKHGRNDTELQAWYGDTGHFEPINPGEITA